ncbi:MAG TPA: XRE family transcriptional regulator [Actinophytocola sp.]|uniref:helix-turn-helix domain-containing protein n=1 Tax=Actinophytocola sp. TaxID=1872138 RepID=UPI002DBFED2A|nr:XRE family transcriptional regulator [Actinophytocola sp.]HEU5472641.1 XRE family transcriptional regulator [Actinophytocola sp.]
MRAEEAAAAFSGERLRLARFRAGLTVREVADRVEVSHAAISQYEIGRTRPTPAVLARLAIATGVSAGFFAFHRRPISPGGLDGTHFRSLRSTTRQGRASAWAWSEIVLDIAEVLERHVRLPDPVVPVRSLAPDAARDELACAAAELRAAWSLPDGPVGHLVRQLEAHGILVARLPVADKGIDAFSHAQGRRPVVVLGTDKADAARSRFDAAHELGHLVCHPDADPGGEQEHQAHAFAAELLMPRAHMLRVLPRRFDLGAYARLKQEWGVSIAALLYRARTLEVISESAYRRAVMIMNRTYGRRTEPYPLPTEERPTLLATAAEVAARSGITLAHIAAQSCLPLDDVRTIVGSTDPRPLVHLDI